MDLISAWEFYVMHGYWSYDFVAADIAAGIGFGSVCEWWITAWAPVDRLPEHDLTLALPAWGSWDEAWPDPWPVR